MIYTITLNPSLDYVLSLDQLHIGEVNRSRKEEILPGGKGINVSVILKNLGISSVAVGYAAGFTGDKLLELLDEREIPHDFIRLENGFTRMNMKIKDTEINGAGPLPTKEEEELLLHMIEGLTDKDMVVIGGSVPSGVNEDMYGQILRLCYEKGIAAVVDTSGKQLYQSLQHHPFLIKPNHLELGELFRVTIDSTEDIIFYGRKLMEAGARNVLISRGDKGAVFLSEKGEVYKMDAPKGNVINPVGAGDSMLAGFLAGYFNGKDNKDALKLGICSGSATAFSVGLAEKQQIMDLYHRYETEGEDDAN